jgi:4'-phosphopantetheinyl transferase
VDVWLADPERAAFQALADRVLSPDEHARAARFTHRRAQRTYRGARALVRQALSRYGDTPAADWRFGEAELGKPFVAAPPCPLGYNLSHTRGLAAVAVVAAGEVGCDVEHLGRRGRLDAIAQRFFAPAELAAMVGLDAAALRARFFDVWTLKEAYTKARGLGLHLPTTRYAVLLDGTGLRLQVEPEAAEPAPETWRFYLADCGDAHRLALATPGPLDVVRARWLEPDGGATPASLSARAR